jgi:hypothetical protein
VNDVARRSTKKIDKFLTNRHERGIVFQKVATSWHAPLIGDRLLAVMEVAAERLGNGALSA